MHDSSLENMQHCFDRFLLGGYLDERESVSVLDLGSMDVNGSYRDIFQHPKIDYIGADLEPGTGVDLVLEDPYRIPLANSSVDVIISGQMLEHCEFFWLTFQEMSRVVTEDGFIFLIAPSAGPIHRYPVDCYRFYPDAYQALAKMSGCHLLEWRLDARGPWHDLVGIFSKKTHREEAAATSSDDIHLAKVSSGSIPSAAPRTAMHRYDTVVSLDDHNVSHAQIVLLVGGNKRVLDVGCATGYVAKELVAHGCMVSGIEISEEAAELAKPYLEQLVIGDLETLDLVAEFGNASFDVVVFGDVLEHLRDPVPVLRQTRDLLAPGGFVVISIPNIAHGDVRLALLQGRWEYRPLGLLDETHLRFFTREGVERMLWEAGFASVEMRRTSAELFATEIGVRPEEFDAAVVEQIRRDDESTTYQFVLKAVPADADSAIHQLREREEAQRLRIEEFEREVAERTQQVADLEGRISGLLELEAELREQLAKAEAELEAVYATRTMRLARVPRAIYARLRSKRNGEGRRPA